MWSLEIGASRDTIYTASIQRAHSLRAGVYLGLLSKIWQSIAAPFEKQVYCRFHFWCLLWCWCVVV